MKPRIAVVGSLNVDLIASVERLPRAGETIAASRLVRRFGGKGANQAFAAARQGAQISMIGAVGDDADGQAYRAYFTKEGIDCVGVKTVRRHPTGTALIAVDGKGENLIIVAPGANGVLTASDVRLQRRRIETARTLLVQMEIPLPAVLEALRIANRSGVSVIFNPSPWRGDFPWGERQIDVVAVNETEASALLGSVPTLRDRRVVSAELQTRRIEALVITRGARATRCFTAADAFEVPAIRVKPVDTVGAGDAFAGTLASALARGFDFGQAVTRANCAGALATLKAGAQEALPLAAEVERVSRSNRRG